MKKDQESKLQNGFFCTQGLHEWRAKPVNLPCFETHNYKRPDRVVPEIYGNISAFKFCERIQHSRRTQHFRRNPHANQAKSETQYTDSY